MQAKTRSAPTIVPCLRYRDAPAAIDWLCKAFGFEKQLAVPDEQGGIAHAQLTFGSGMVMLGSARDNEFGRLMKQPDEIAGAETQCPYVIVADPDAHHARAKAAGATIVAAPADQDYGGRLYSCRDPEGHLWNFGSYDPWAESGGKD
ncbi:MAG: VOC family protein [Kiloniellales bacterium]